MLELTEELIADVMRRADKIACTGDPGCVAFPDAIEDVRKTVDRHGRCVAGWITSTSGRIAWDVLLDLNTGEGRLRRRPDPR
jgi:hypothetical protein